MKGKTFELNENTLAIIEEIGGHMPGGFYIYRTDEPEELIYANKAVFSIYGCDSIEEFKELTGYTFRGMVYPEDFDRISSSIVHQMPGNRRFLMPQEDTDLYLKRRSSDGKIT